MILVNYYKIFEFWIFRKIWLIKFWSIWNKTIVKYWLFWDAKNINIWNYVYIWENCNLWALWWIDIWDWTIIWPNVIIRSSNHNYKTWDYIPYWPKSELKKVEIWENCWIWDNVLITPGTMIWEWSIIWMGAVVSWNIPKYSIVVWNPWNVIKNRNEELYENLKKEWKIYLKSKLEWKI